MGQSTVKLRRVWKVLVSPSEKKKPARPSRNIKDDSLKGTYTAWAPDSPERERESERERARERERESERESAREREEETRLHSNHKPNPKSSL